MTWIPWSPIGLALPDYGDANLETAKRKSAEAAGCKTLLWQELPDGSWKLIWPDGAARLYLMQDDTKKAL